MFAEADTSKPVTRIELDAELAHYATKNDFRGHIREVERLVSSLSAIMKEWTEETPSQGGVEGTEKASNNLVHELKRRIDSEISLGDSFDKGLVQIRLSSIMLSCDSLRSAVERLETSVLQKLEAVRSIGADVIEKLEIVESFEARLVEKLQSGGARTRRKRQ